jgi:hypothetical protein
MAVLCQPRKTVYLADPNNKGAPGPSAKGKNAAAYWNRSCPLTLQQP